MCMCIQQIDTHLIPYLPHMFPSYIQKTSFLSFFLFLLKVDVIDSSFLSSAIFFSPPFLSCLRSVRRRNPSIGGLICREIIIVFHDYATTTSYFTTVRNAPDINIYICIRYRISLIACARKSGAMSGVYIYVCMYVCK